MNIFYVDRDPVKAAQMMCDKHIVKMILESAQMLCTAKRVLDGTPYEDKTKNGRKIKRWRLENPNEEAIVYKAGWAKHVKVQSYKRPSCCTEIRRVVKTTTKEY